MNEFRYALRTLAKSPGFTAAAVLTLALGIGANTAIFSVVDGVLLRPAPFADVDSLVMVWETDRKSGTRREPASVPDYLDFRARTTRLEAVAAFAPAEVNLTPERGDPLRLAALTTSHEFLPMVGIRPLLGRTFTADEDRPGAPRVALIGEDLWAQLFSRDPAVVGRSLRVNDLPYEIVGVLPAAADFGTLQVLKAADYSRGFADRGGSVRVDIWAPLRADPRASPRETHPIFVLGRLGKTATVPLAQQELAAVAADLERTYPENDARGVSLEPLAGVVFGPVRPALFILLGAVALVLLVACANVANLLLARGASRKYDVMVRTALGAGTGQLARLFLAESAALTVGGALVGVLFALWGLDVLVTLAPADIPRMTAVGLDMRVLGATLGVAMLVALAFGMLPLLQTRGRDLHASLAGARPRGASSGPERSRFRAGLVVAEVALAVMVMVGAGLLIKSLWRLQQVDPGFRAAGVLKAEYQLPESRYPRNFGDWPNWPEMQRFNDELQRRVAALPGALAATIAASHPLDAGFTSSIRVVGREAEAADWPEPAIRIVAAGYFETLDVPLQAGRTFTTTDDVRGGPVALINDAARRRFFTQQDPIGQRIRLWGADRTLVGVVGNERFHGLAAAVPPAVYLPLAQVPSASGGYSLLVRAGGAPVALAPGLRAIVRELDPALPLFGVEPLATTLSTSVGQRRFTMIVLGAFAALALLLAAVGVHGVMSYTVAQRTREIGIRMALGADPRGVRTLIVSQAAVLAAGGLALGLVGALAVTRLLATLLYGVGPRDPTTFAGVALALGAVAVLASFLPARSEIGRAHV